MVNVIYFIVAILMFISWTQYFGNESNAGKWNKRFHSIMQIIFFISNVVCLALWRQNEYWRLAIGKSTTNENVTISMAYIICGIPIIIYIIEVICYLLKKKTESVVAILWFIYTVLFTASVFFVNPCIESKEIIQEHKNVVRYREEVVKSTFLNDSINGIDYMIKQQDLDGREEDNIIKTRTWDDDIKVEVYPHQKSSYIEKCITEERHITFFGNIYEESKDEILYKIYLSDDMYQSK